MMIFNGVDTSSLINITKISGRGPLSQEVLWYNIPGRNGKLFIKKKIRERPIQVEFDLVGDSLEDIRLKIDTLNNILSTKAPVPIVFKDEVNITYYGILDGKPDWDEYLFIGSGSINIICPDPYKYGAEKSLTVSSAGVTNEGTVETNPIFTVTFTAAANEFKILHQQTGKFVRVIWNFVVGDKLVLDFTTRKITINNNVRMTVLDFSSNWFMLVPGSNKFTITPSSVATTTIKYRPRWK